MRIGIDARLWNESGVGRYIRNLVQNLSRIDQKNEYVLFFRKQEYDKVQSPASNFQKRLADIRWHTIEEQIKLPQLLYRESLDLMHFPYFSVPIFYNKRFVVTIHDLIINQFPTGKASTLPLFFYLTKRIGYGMVISHAVRGARKIIVPTKSVKKEVASRFYIPGNTIAVTYEGGFENKKIQRNSIPTLSVKNYFLRVGNAYPHKNLERFIQAFFLFCKDIKDDIRLILVGKEDFFYEKLKKFIAGNSFKERVIFYGAPNDNELIALYQNAKALFIPSLAEGFSLTAVEAMSLGCPVVASDIDVHKEICGDAALYFDPYNTLDIKEKMLSLISADKQILSMQKEKGLKRAQQFSWQNMAEETLRIYEGSISLR